MTRRSNEQPSMHGLGGEPAPLAGAWWVTATLLVVYVASFVDRAILYLLVGAIRRDLGISDTEMSLLIGLAFALLYLGMSIPLGLLADRRNRTRLIALACTVWSLATTASGFVDGYWPLFACRVMVGFAEAALIPAVYSLLADYFPRHRLAQALSVYSAGAWIGVGTALMVGGAIMQRLGALGSVDLPWIGQRQDWQVAFLAVGPPGLVLALLVLLIREPARGGFCAVEEQRGDIAPAPVSLADTARFVARHWGFFGRHLIGFGLFSTLAQAIMAWVPTALVRAHGVTPGVVGLRLGALYLSCSVVGIVLAGVLSDRLYRRGRLEAPMQVGAIGIAVLAVVTIGVVLAPTFETALLLAAGMTFFISFPLGVAATALQYATPARMRGQLSALYLLVTGALGMGLGPTVVALLTDYVFGNDLAVGRALAVTAAICGLISPVLLWRGARAMRALLERVS